MNAECQILLEKSKENMEAAIDLAASEKFNAAANRLYYSLFQAVKAYGVIKSKMRMDESARVHNTASGIAHELTKGNSKFEDLFEDALNLRKKSDYQPLKVLKGELDLTFRNNASDLRNEIERLAKSA